MTWASAEKLKEITLTEKEKKERNQAIKKFHDDIRSLKSELKTLEENKLILENELIETSRNHYKLLDIRENEIAKKSQELKEEKDKLNAEYASYVQEQEKSRKERMKKLSAISNFKRETENGRQQLDFSVKDFERKKSEFDYEKKEFEKEKEIILQLKNELEDLKEKLEEEKKEIVKLNRDSDKKLTLITKSQERMNEEEMRLEQDKLKNETLLDAANVKIEECKLLSSKNKKEMDEIGKLLEKVEQEKKYNKDWSLRLQELETHLEIKRRNVAISHRKAQETIKDMRELQKSMKEGGN